MRYSALDSNAPLLLPSVGSLNTLLETCLNIGYPGKPSANWGIPYRDETRQMVFQTGAGSRGRYFQINDNFDSTPRYASIYGFETMSNVNMGTNKFPNDTQIVIPAYSNFIKSTGNDLAARNWSIYADSKICYCLINPDANYDFSNACLHIFGDFVTYNPSDYYNTLLITRTGVSTNNMYNNAAAMTCIITQTLDGNYALRSYTQFSGSIKLGKHGNNYCDGMQFPNPVDNSLGMSRIYITEPGVLRGHLPGLWRLHAAATNFNHGDMFSGTGNLTGKEFEIIKTNGGVFAIEISDTWYS